MASKKANNSVWSSTKYKYLYKHQSGVYYARVSIKSKKTWRSLRTKVMSVAQHKLKELLEDLQLQGEMNSEDCHWESVGDLIRARIKQIENDASLKPRTKSYWNDIYNALQRSWPELSELTISKVTNEQCENWAGRYVDEISATRYNNTISALKKLFELAIENGIRRVNPAGKLKRVKPSQKDLTGKLPDRPTFHLWVHEIRTCNNRWSEACGDLVEFLAYTGMRLGEAQSALWKHVDYKSGEIIVIGDPEEGTKNRQIRRVPIIEDLSTLLEAIKARKGIENPEDKILSVSIARKAMRSASEKIGIEHLTHHDLRHLFATTCIESGVDIPTVSKWLGHKDGGALAMRVYGHLRNEHSLAEAKKVKF